MEIRKPLLCFSRLCQKLIEEAHHLGPGAAVVGGEALGALAGGDAVFQGPGHRLEIIGALVPHIVEAEGRLRRFGRLGRSIVRIQPPFGAEILGIEDPDGGMAAAGKEGSGGRLPAEDADARFVEFMRAGGAGGSSSSLIFASLTVTSTRPVILVIRQRFSPPMSSGPFRFLKCSAGSARISWTL